MSSSDTLWSLHVDNIRRPPVSPSIQQKFSDTFEVSDVELRELPYSIVPDNDNHQTQLAVSQATPSVCPSTPAPTLKTPVSQTIPSMTLSPSWKYNIDSAETQSANAQAVTKPITKPKVGERYFEAGDLDILVHYAVEFKPFLVAHGCKTQVWKDMTKKLLEEPSFQMKKADWQLVQHKNKALINYKKNPGSSSPDWDFAKNKNDEQKAAIRQKQDEDIDGGH
ncbi:hypothetical protein FB446DRAFT_710192 [Lentinula raphanica]|nr:hypothetical protein FB446DRAFT_710192 [Lentinula raphanica]